MGSVSNVINEYLRFEGEGQAWVYAVTEFLHPEQV